MYLVLDFRQKVEPSQTDEHSERVSVLGKSGCPSESVWMSSPKISAWRGCLAPETGFFHTGAALDVSGDQVYFCPRAKHEPRARRADSDKEDEESEDEGEATTLGSRMVIAFKSLANPAPMQFSQRRFFSRIVL